ncbi:hypothetical protein DFH09DRAFT_1085405 [Mycena vulgaris]|nr:hypothetical protein DFH09DRAFT_1085405 [Mycena vulgaris]
MDLKLGFSIVSTVALQVFQSARWSPFRPIYGSENRPFCHVSGPEAWLFFHCVYMSFVVHIVPLFQNLQLSQLAWVYKLKFRPQVALLAQVPDLAECSPFSPDEDTVSIPSSSNESGVDESPRFVQNPPVSPIKVEPASAQPSSQGKFILPPFCLAFSLLISSSPLLPGQSLPDLVLDFTLGWHRFPVKGDKWKRGRTLGRTPNQPAEIRWLTAAQKELSGSSKPFVNPSLNPLPVSQIKHYYYCTTADHLVALCPLHEPSD